MENQDTSSIASESKPRGRPPKGLTARSLPAKVRLQLDNMLRSTDMSVSAIQAHLAGQGYTVGLESLRKYASRFRKQAGIMLRPGRPPVAVSRDQAIAQVKALDFTLSFGTVKRARRIASDMVQILSRAEGEAQ